MAWGAHRKVAFATVPAVVVEMLTVACVLRSGGVYDAEWARKLRRGVAEHLSVEHRFACLTDMEREVEAVGVEAISLLDDWSGWWSKVELFRPGLLTGRTLFFDLDTIIVGSLDAIAGHRHGFTMTHEYYRPNRMCSTAMAWAGDYSEIWRQMKADPAGVMARYTNRTDRRLGDQAFIEDVLAANGVQVRTFRDLFGERSIASFKEHAKRGVPPGAAAVAFHGHPKPPQANGWAKEWWESL